MTKINPNLQGIDIVSAITQKAINNQFASYYKLKIIPEYLDLNLPRNIGKLKVHLLAPTVVVGLENKPRKVLFLQHFSSGVFSSTDDKGAPTEVAFDAGVFAFEVDIHLADIEQSQAPAAVQGAVKNLGPGMFSMRQLYLVLQDAKLATYDTEHTTLPKSLTDDPFFVIGLAMLFKKMHETGGNVIGYAVSVNNPNGTSSDPPTFAPTDIDFSTHIYVDETTKQKNKDLDTINYLLMTKHHPFPNTEPVGNFLDSPVDGVMAISRSSFIEGYLLPAIQKVTNATSTFSSIYYTSAGINTVFGDGFEPIEDPNQPMYEQISAELEQITTQYIEDYTDFGTPIPADAPGGNTPGQYPPGSKARQWIFRSMGHIEKVMEGEPIWGSCTVFRGIAWHLCEMTISPGPPPAEIVLRGSSSVALSWILYGGIRRHAMYTLHEAQSRFEWSASIKLKADSTGAIVADIDFKSKDILTKQDGNWISKIDNWAYPEQANRELQGTKDALASGISSQRLAKSLSDALSTQNKFVFPGGNQYFFKDISFSEKLDLLATLTIKLY